jgi:hypothetical protein
MKVVSDSGWLGMKGVGLQVVGNRVYKKPSLPSQAESAQADFAYCCRDFNRRNLSLKSVAVAL